ncbi:MAG: tuaC 2 [Lacunisphaera sp.]|nr:tuaC 2 [Lacunisphaera sp.]
MHETPTAHLHWDPPHSGPFGGTILHGWLVPKPGRHFTDLRAVAGAEIFPGVYGLPRQDLAEFFKTGQRYLLGGFVITLQLPVGPHRVTLEGCTITGAWEPIEAIDCTVSPTEALPDPDGRSPLNAAAVGEILRVLLRRLADPRVTPREGAAAMVRDSPARHHLQHPPRPFHGHLDQPHVWSFALFGRVPLTGWVYHEQLTIRRVFATTDLQAMQNLKYGRETPFLAARTGTPPHSSHVGYDGFLDVPAQLPRPVTVRVYAEMEDGSWHLGSVARFNLTDQEFVKQPFAAFSRLTFWRAWRETTRQIRARGWSLPGGPADRDAVRQAWRDYSDWAPRRRLPPQPAADRPDSRGDMVHLITHNLSHEGAPLFLLEYARHLQRETGLKLAVTSAREGPLRREFEALGATVRVVDLAPLAQPRNAASLRRGLEAVAKTVDLRDARLVVANTISSWWAVHLAHRARRPALLYIHESTPPRAFFHHLLPASALAVIEESFRLANRVSFLTPSTQRYYSDLSDGTNFCLNPGWIDLARIDEFRAAHSRAALRTARGLAPNRRLVVNVGTVCERKGQHVFARAVDWLWRVAPELAAPADFLMVGGRDTPYDRDLADFLAVINRPNLRIVAETGEVYPYFGAADLFVCSSFEESFPRVVLEAMAFGLPIASTNVHGIPEIARPDREALLVPPGDHAALAAALQRLLTSPELGAALAQSARARVAAEFDSRRVLPRHAALARELMRLPS